LEEVAIQLEGVGYRYPDGTLALDGVNMRILKGERVVILGPNGAGKSTLVMHLNGVFTATQGDVKVLGIPVENRSLREIRSRVGVVFQKPEDQLFCPTLREDVAFGPLSMGLPADEVDERVQWALETVRLRGYEERAPHHLSVGEMKRAAIATVLAMKPEVLVLDEPTADLDPESTRELVDFLTKLHEASGITLVLATHNVNIAPLLADRVFVMSRGRVVGEGLIHDVLSNQPLIKQAGLELPTITQFFNKLGDHGLANSMPLTVDEGVEHFLARFASRKKWPETRRERRSTTSNEKR